MQKSDEWPLPPLTSILSPVGGEEELGGRLPDAARDDLVLLLALLYRVLVVAGCLRNHSGWVDVELINRDDSVPIQVGLPIQRAWGPPMGSRCGEMAGKPLQAGGKVGRCPQVPSDRDRRLWRDHHTGGDAQSSVVKFHQVRTRSDRHHGGSTEVLGPADPPAVNDDLGLPRRHFDLEGGVGRGR